MTDGQCEKCGKPIDPKYKFCLACVDAMKKANIEAGANRGSAGGEETVKALGAINNNLYAIRTQLDILLRYKLGKGISWDPQEKRFLEIAVKKVRK
jgi:Na+-translocating ferredoxin:NAD+ oxidoreductase RNF subunit RnfB